MDEAPTIPAHWGGDTLASFLDACTSNTYSVFQNRHEWYGRLSSVDDTYHLLLENIESDPELYGGLFALRCHSAFLGACRLALSGQVPETYMLLRGCLEAALYGLYIAKNPRLRHTWIHRHKNDRCRKPVRSEFTISKLKQCLADVDRDVHDRVCQYYSYTIDLGAHPNIMSVEAHINDEAEAGPLTLHYLHPLSDVLLATFKVCAVTGITGLDVLRYVFPDAYSKLNLESRLRKLKKGL